MTDEYKDSVEGGPVEDLGPHYVMELGGIYAAEPKPESADPGERSVSPDDARTLDAETADKTVREAISDDEYMSIVSDLKAPWQPYQDETSEGILWTGEPYHVAVDLPPDSIHLKGLGGKAGTFQAVVCGSFFGAFRPVPGIPSSSDLERTFGSELTRVIYEHEANIAARQAVPGLTERRIYITWDRSSEEENINVSALAEDVLAVVEGESILLPDTLASILTSALPPLSEYYNLGGIYSDLDRTWKSVDESFDATEDAIERFHDTPWWRIFKRLQLADQAREEIRTLKSDLVTFEDRKISFGTVERIMKMKVRVSEVLAVHPNYFERGLAYMEIDLPDSLVSTVDYFEKQIGRFRSARNTILASVFGAVVGAALTAILTYVLAA